MIGLFRRLFGLVGKAPRAEDDGNDTEFCAEVVRVTEVLPHPNADRLELVRFERAAGPTAYTVVDGKGHRSPGSLAVYCSVDAIVPLGRKEFKFLGERLDGAGKTEYRLRAARLRGVYSEGLLVDAPADATLGQSIAKDWGIGYYNPEPKQSLSNGPTPKTRVPSRIERLVPQYSVASLRKVPDLFADGEPVIITEKVHGTNFRFGWVGDEWVYGSHRVIKSDHRSKWRRFKDWALRRKLKAGHWYKDDVWAHAVSRYGLMSECLDHEDIIFYGEIYGAGIQDMTYNEPGIGLVLFDAYDTVEGRFLPRAELERRASWMGLQVAPRLYSGPFSMDTVKALAEGKSHLDEKTIREGVVVESQDTTVKAKYVGEGYRLRKY